MTIPDALVQHKKEPRRQEKSKEREKNNFSSIRHALSTKNDVILKKDSSEFVISLLIYFYFYFFFGAPVLRSVSHGVRQEEGKLPCR